MIFTSAKQLKDWVHNLSMKSAVPAGTLLQNYLMERFLERVAVSPYQNNMILKGGFLIAAMIGADKRSTMDIDTTIKGLPAGREQIEEMLRGIISLDIGDGATFKMISIKSIHDVTDYDDYRVSLDVSLFTIRGNLKIDITVGDVIIPRETEYSYKLMFEDRSINIVAYNLNTILAEKIETVLSRNVSNTRGRDFYDIYMLISLHQQGISRQELLHAVQEKARERSSTNDIINHEKHLADILNSPEMNRMWQQYTSRYIFAKGIELEWVIRLIQWVFGGIDK